MRRRMSLNIYHDRDYYKRNLKQMGPGGVLFFIGMLLLIYGLYRLYLALIVIGVILVIVGFVLTPGMKKPDESAYMKDQFQGYATQRCPTCGRELAFDYVTQTYARCTQCVGKRQCRSCGSELVHNEGTGLFYCGYCNVDYRNDEC
ncbi:MAG: hypothetical protein FWG45_05690 [Oscillospiraceae bacterium]|nr:hypothetical protein [Oscillospiraceae bacterium]